MTYVWLPVGLALPTLCGWMFLILLEGRSRVLFTWERWVLGFVLGGTLTMFCTFLLHILGVISLSKMGFFSVQAVLVVLLFFALWKRKLLHLPSPSLPRPSSLSGTKKNLVGIIFLWMIAKIITSAISITITPIYPDDVFNNWNLRGKVYFQTEALTLGYREGDGELNRFSAYPPTIPMTKAWLAELNGEWHEGLVTSVHLLWYISALLVVFFLLARLLSFWWGVIGAYILSSLPLVMIHASLAYGDMHLSVHLLIAVAILLLSVRHSGEEQKAFIRLFWLSAGLLVFTKNEALLLYLPLLGLIYTLSFRKYLLGFIGSIGVVLVPWTLYKWQHALEFANATTVSSYSDTFGLQEGALSSLWITLFFEGNWLLLLPILFGLLIIYRREYTSGALWILAAFFLGAFVLQMSLYLFTHLSTLALNQTGTARGVLHLLPIAVILMTIGIQRSWSTKEP